MSTAVETGRCSFLCEPLLEPNGNRLRNERIEGNIGRALVLMFCVVGFGGCEPLGVAMEFELELSVKVDLRAWRLSGAAFVRL